MSDFLYALIVAIASIIAAIPWTIVAVQDYRERKFMYVGADIFLVIISLSCSVGIFTVV